MAVVPRGAFAQDLQGSGSGKAPPSASASPDVTPSGGPLVLVSVKGVFGLLSQTGGACSPATCTASKTCECQSYEADGIRSSAISIGKINVTFDETLNDTDVISAGPTGSNCRPFFGTGAFIGPKGVTAADFFASGWSCGANSLFADAGTFYIIPGTGSGALANACGTGTLNFTKDFGVDQAIFYMAGDIQRNP